MRGLRQVKSKMIKEDADLAKLKSGDLLMLMGTADVVTAPSKPVVFEEDLTDNQKAKLSEAALPCGLENLENTYISRHIMWRSE